MIRDVVRKLGLKHRGPRRIIGELEDRLQGKEDFTNDIPCCVDPLAYIAIRKGKLGVILPEGFRPIGEFLDMIKETRTSYAYYEILHSLMWQLLGVAERLSEGSP